MAITDRNLQPGTRLVANYRKTRFVCTVEAGTDGKLAFVLEDGKRFSSPSAAGSAVMDGTACNGWRWWAVEGQEPAPGQPKAKAAGTTARPKAEGATPKRTSKAKAVKVFYRIPNQRGTPEGFTRFYCNGCAASFESEMESPEACPQGHRNDDPELTSAPGGAAVAADKAEATA